MTKRAWGAGVGGTKEVGWISWRPRAASPKRWSRRSFAAPATTCSPSAPANLHCAFSPDFRITQRLDDGDEQKYLVAVKCRPSAEQFISVENQRGNRSIFHMMRRHWPTLYFVLVTERPEAGRSCFQVLAFDTVRQGEPFRMVDLVEIKEFGVFAHNVEDHEALARSIFSSLTA